MLINLRNALMAGRRKPTAKSYVQDGLVAMWDGIENAGWGVHDPNATVWRDLTGNGYDIVFPSGYSHAQWLPNGIRFTKADDTSWAFIPVDISVFGDDYDSVRATAECVQKRISSVGKSWSFGGISQTCGAGGIGYYDANVCNLWTRRDSDGVRSIQYKNDDLQPHYLANRLIAPYTYDLILDGSSITVDFSWTSSATRKPRDYTFFGADAPARFVHDFYTFRLYSRALTADEIARNYAIDKARFNLP